MTLYESKWSTSTRTIRINLQRPHVSQRAVIAGARRFNIVCCGRRWGKTELGLDRLVQPALAGLPAAWFAPTYKLAAPVWRELQRRLYEVTARVNQQERRLDLVTGGSIEVWAMDSPDAGRGRAYALVVIDEAAMIPYLQDAWQESIRAQLTDYCGAAWFLSTPKGIANYFHTLFQRGQDVTVTEWASWQQPTKTNPLIDPDEVDAARGDLTDLAFAQEYLAQFVSWEGAVFRDILDAVYEPPQHGQACAIGVDWGRTTDYTVFAAVSRKGEVLALDRFRGIEYALQRERLRVFWEKWGRTWIVAEMNSIGGPIVEQLQRDGLPVQAFHTTAQSKPAIIESLALAFERQTIKIPNDAALIGELQAFEATPRPGGGSRYSAPSGVHDDTVMALAIAWQGLGAWESTQRNHMDLVAPYQISPV